MKKQGDQPIWQSSDEIEPEVEELDETDIEPEEESDELAPLKEKKRPSSYESFADRLPNVKKERNHRLYRRLALIISILMLAVLIVFYFVSPLSKLGQVSVSGNETIDSNLLIEKSSLTKGKSLWEQFIDRELYEKKIKDRLPKVKKASISLSGINSFRISVQEYEIVAISAENGSYQPILENGVILDETVASPESGKPIFESFESSDIIKELMVSYKKLSPEIKQAISEIKYTPSKVNKELITLYMNDQNQVLVNISQLSEKMSYYTQVAGQMESPGVVDMEVGIFSYNYPTESSETEETIEE